MRSWPWHKITLSGLFIINYVIISAGGVIRKPEKVATVDFKNQMLHCRVAQTKASVLLRGLLAETCVRGGLSTSTVLQCVHWFLLFGPLSFSEAMREARLCHPTSPALNAHMTERPGAVLPQLPSCFSILLRPLKFPPQWHNAGHQTTTRSQNCGWRAQSSDILFPYRSPSPRPHPDRTQHPEKDPKRTWNGPETDPNRPKRTRNGPKTNPKWTESRGWGRRGVCRDGGGVVREKENH